jgi:hypothetical protein
MNVGDHFIKDLFGDDSPLGLFRATECILHQVYSVAFFTTGSWFEMIKLKNVFISMALGGLASFCDQFQEVEALLVADCPDIPISKNS